MPILKTFAPYLVSTALLCTGCGNEPPAAPAPEPAPSAVAPVDTHHDHAHEHAATDTPVAALPKLAADAKVFFVEPADGATITGPIENGAIKVTVKMGATGVAIKPAGALEDGSGHHHVLIDIPAMAAGTVVPKDEQHLHFGQGQTEATIAVPPGSHTLTLQLADGIHRSYGDALSASIKVTVAGLGTLSSTKPAPAPAPAH
jgi:hypothetical protein